MTTHAQLGSARASAQTWCNWSGNLVYEPPTNGASFYFMPNTLSDLQGVLAPAAKIPGLTVRVSGQRHSQPPLVVNDNRGAVQQSPTTYLVDMSCYADLGTSGTQCMILGPGPNQVTVNPGVKEDALDAFLTQNNLMLPTVTAGGFFSVGGMTAVDVHGGTVNAPIFAETAAVFTIMNYDGSQTTIDAQSEDGNGNSLLAFARVSLGALGVVTRITLNVLPRAYANTLQGGSGWYLTAPFQESDFIATFKSLLAQHSRMECFFSPYAGSWPGFSSAFVLWWDLVVNPNPTIPNSATTPRTACELAEAKPPQYGAPLLGGLAKYAPPIIIGAQNADSPTFHLPIGAAEITRIALGEIETQGQAANKSYSDLWLVASSSVIFMSYFIPIADLQEAGLGTTWAGLNAVTSYVTQDGNFHTCAPVEFRFVQSGNTAMAGTFSTKPNAVFVNLDLIGWVDLATTSPPQYPTNLLQFFANVERQWVKLGGLPHNGKMYGFYDPTNPDQTSYTPPFNANFLTFITQQRIKNQAPVAAFNSYRKSVDPNGMFYNQYLQNLLGT